MTRRYTGGFLTAKEQATDSNTANGIFTLSDAQALTAQGNFPTGRWTPQRSLRFRSTASTRLNRTPSSAPTSRTTHTMSVWVKRGSLSNGSTQALFGTNNNYENCTFFTDDSIRFTGPYSAGTQGVYVTTAKYRDISSWYHLVFVYDTTNSNANDRMQLYVNGSRVTSFSTQTTAAQNATTTEWLVNGFGSGVGTTGGSGSGALFDGYMAEVNVIDGQALDASYFGMNDPTTGTWIPKRYTGSYGTNGFYLPFKDNQNTVTLGKNYGNGGNLLTQSDKLSNVVWSRSGNTITSSSVADPFGGFGGFLFTTTSGYVPIYRTTTLSAGAVYTSSCYFKAGGSSVVSLTVGDGTLTNTFGATFNLVGDGTVQPSTWIGAGNVYSAGSGTMLNKYITSVGNGWYRCVITGIVDTTTTGIRTDFVLPASTTINMYGPQLEYGTEVGAYQGTAASAISNDWTVNNFSLTANQTYDSMVDVPGICAVSSQKDVGGVVRGNYCTTNPAIRQYSSVDSTGSSQPSETWLDGNLRTQFKHDGVSGTVYGTQVLTTGKWYFEMKDIYEPGDAPVNYAVMTGVAKVTPVVYNGTYSGSAHDNGYLYTSAGDKWVTGTKTSFGASYTTNDIIGIAVDVDAATIQFYKNNVLQGTITNLDTSNGLIPTFEGIKQNTGAGWNTSNIPAEVSYNFGQQPFVYTPPVGYKSICTTNMPNPIIKRSSDHFDVKTYTGNGSSLMVGNAQKQVQSASIPRSIRFRPSASSFLTRTPTVAGNRKVSTFSCWFKRGTINARQAIFGCANSSDTATLFVGIDANNRIEVDGHTLLWRLTSATFTDTSKWHHLVLAVDTNQTSADNRIKLFVDGVKISSFTTYNNPSQGADMGLNQASVAHNFGQMGSTIYYDGYITEANFVDGQQLDPTAFGQYDANNNWVPKSYSGTYGTNGFYIKGSDVSGNKIYSAKFNGSNYLSLANPTGLTLGTGDFTIEGWMFVNSGSGTNGICILDYRAPADNLSMGPLFSTDGNGVLTWTASYETNGWLIVGTTVLSNNRWHHVAVSRSGGVTRMFLNGVQEGSSYTDTKNYTTNTNRPFIGANANASGANGLLNGYLSNFRIIKGTGLYSTNFTPSTFNLTAVANTQLLTCNASTIVDASTNAYTITNNGSVSTAVEGPFGGFGYDYSGTGNFYLSAYMTGTSGGVSYDSVTDSPVDFALSTTSDVGNVITGNYCILDANSKNSGITVSNGGMAATAASTNQGVRGTLSVTSGKWYYEVILGTISGSAPMVGWVDSNWDYAYVGDYGNGWAYAANGQTYNPNNNCPTLATYTTNDVIGVAFDADAGTLSFYKNGTLAGTPFVGLLKNGPYYPAWSGQSNFCWINFGQIPFSQTPPAGYKSLNTKNLNDVGSNNLPDTFGNLVNTPDLAWIKVRNTALSHNMYDTVRGPSQRIQPNLGNAQSNIEGVVGFLPNGLQLGNGTDDVNYTVGNTYVSWMWNRGKVPGFDIVQYSGNGTGGNQIKHNLGTAPSMIIIKNLTTGTTNWPVYHKGLSAISNTSVLYLNDTTYPGAITANLWNSTVPGNEYFTVGDTSAVNGSTNSYIAYLWAEVPGFSKFGSYVGNGSADGPFIYTGFRPKFIMYKRTDTTSDWKIIDSTRNTANPVISLLAANTSGSEDSNSAYSSDFLSNGYKIRFSLSGANASGGTYIYAAFAEAPFKYANAR